MTGVLPWTLFSTALTEMSNSLLNNSSIISKVYFPRLLIPLSTLVVNIVDFLIALGLLVVLMVVLGYWPTWRYLFVPLMLILTILTVSGCGIMVAALNVAYRDFRYIVPFALSLGWFLSPVGFSSEIVPGHWRFVYSLNPMVAQIEGFRWCIIGTAGPIYWPGMAASMLLSAIMIVVGVRYFRQPRAGICRRDLMGMTA